MAYSLGKVTFIDTITQKSGFEGFRLLLALTPQKWEAYHRIREKEIFEPIGVSYDRNHPTLSQDNHFHFVLYKGIDIISDAHIEFLTPTEAALRSLATDELYKKKGYGTYLLTQLETWIKHQGRSLLKMHGRLSAEHFYRRLGYYNMPFDDPAFQRECVNLGKTL
ncbi:MAG: GNAT family N-acetyltransferase [Proteobacteria bacterium]|nr:GNAT family N-acetyltransferase [Pseudomonadota bacterium]